MLDPQEVIKEMQSLNIVAKTVSTQPNTQSSSLDRVLFLLMQLENPSYFRPTKNRKPDHRDINVVVQNRTVTLRPKPNMFFTKKTAVTLLSENGKTDLYMPRMRHPVGFLFCLDKCHLKEEKYIFPIIAETDKGNNRYNAPKVSLEQLRNYLAHSVQRGQIASANELDIGLSLRALVGIFSPINDKRYLKYAKNVQKLVLNRLKLTLPLFLITPDLGVLPWNSKKDLLHDSLEDCYLGFVCSDILHSIIRYLSVHDMGHLLMTHKTFFKQLDNHPYFLQKAKLLGLDTRNISPKKEKSLDTLILSYYLKPFNCQITAVHFEHIKNHALKNPDLARRLLFSEYYAPYIPNHERVFTKGQNSILGVVGGLIFSLTLIMVVTSVFTLVSLLQLLAAVLSLGGSMIIFQTSIMRSILGITLSPVVAVLSSIFLLTCYCWEYGFNPEACFNLIGKIYLTIYFGDPEENYTNDPWACYDIPQREGSIRDCIEKRAPGFLESKITKLFVETLADSAFQTKALDSHLLRFLEWFYLSIRSECEEGFECTTPDTIFSI